MALAKTLSLCRIVFVVETLLQLLLVSCANDIIPTNYNFTVNIKVKDESLSYECSLIITLECKRSSKYFQFHSAGPLNLKRKHITLLNGNARNIKSRIKHRHRSWLFEVKLSKRVRPGQILILRIKKYIVPFPNADEGMKTVLSGPKSTKHDNYKQRMFFYPCFRGSGIRATYDLSVEYPTNIGIFIKATSDLIRSVQTGSTSRTSYFERSLKVSPSQFNLVVLNTTVYRISSQEVEIGGNYTQTNVLYKDSQIRKFSCRPTCNCTVNYVHKLIEESITFISNFTGVPYPWKELNVIIADDRFLFDNYMKNILIIPSIKSICMKRLFPHIIAHAWFGTAVQYSRKEDFWLSEGLPDYLSVLFHSKIHDNVPIYLSLIWEYIDSHVLYVGLYDVPLTLGRMRLWARPDLRPIVLAKSIWIFNMLESILGETRFRLSLRAIFTTYRFSTITNEDVCDIMNDNIENRDTDICKWMNEWINNTGFPIVTFTRSGTNITARQYDIFGRNITWPIPLYWSIGDCFTNLRRNDGESIAMKFLMNTSVAHLPVEVPKDSCFEPNPDYKSFYVPIYDNETWAYFIKYFNNFTDELSSMKDREGNPTAYLKSKHVKMQMVSFVFLHGILTIPKRNEERRYVPSLKNHMRQFMKVIMKRYRQFRNVLKKVSHAFAGTSYGNLYKHAMENYNYFLYGVFDEIWF